MRRPVLFGLRVLAVALIVVGAIWVLQGVNVLPGSFMTGDIRWAYRGAAAVVVGVVLLVVQWRSR
jgi:hypothetical protein